MFKKYMVRLSARVVIFLTILYFYLFHHETIASFVDFKLFGKFTPLHVLWIVLMLGMILHLLPKSKITMSGRKSRPPASCSFYRLSAFPAEKRRRIHDDSI